jgi:hypothetical protein
MTICDFSARLEVNGKSSGALLGDRIGTLQSSWLIGLAPCERTSLVTWPDYCKGVTGWCDNLSGA